tara:strand:+ start:14811 stop:15305 length:495 start_codon:yes stop_codon:yes gene_type:complete
MGKKLSLAAPNMDSGKRTLVTGVSASAGFLGGRLVRNKVPQLQTMPAKAALLLVSLGIHASIEGDGLDADAIRGLALGFGVNQAAQLADVVGDKLQEKRDDALVSGASETVNGLLDFGAALLSDNYVPKGSPVTEFLDVQEVVNGMQDYTALNYSQEMSVSALS